MFGIGIGCALQRHRHALTHTSLTFQVRAERLPIFAKPAARWGLAHSPDPCGIFPVLF